MLCEVVKLFVDYPGDLNLATDLDSYILFYSLSSFMLAFIAEAEASTLPVLPRTN